MSAWVLPLHVGLVSVGERTGQPECMTFNHRHPLQQCKWTCNWIKSNIDVIENSRWHSHFHPNGLMIHHLINSSRLELKSKWGVVKVSLPRTQTCPHFLTLWLIYSTLACDGVCLSVSSCKRCSPPLHLPPLLHPTSNAFSVVTGSDVVTSFMLRENIHLQWVVDWGFGVWRGVWKTHLWGHVNTSQEGSGLFPTHEYDIDASPQHWNKVLRISSIAEVLTLSRFKDPWPVLTQTGPWIYKFLSKGPPANKNCTISV